jgi:hypothetical protein
MAPSNTSDGAEENLAMNSAGSTKEAVTSLREVSALIMFNQV